jgi:hypothetical protein
MRDAFGLSRRAGAVALVVLAAVGVGVAVAAIPSANGIIAGCVNKASGALRVIDVENGQACNRRLENRISWNQTGSNGADVRYAQRDTNMPVLARGALTEVLRIDNLAPGAYVITANVGVVAAEANRAGGDVAGVGCRLLMVAGGQESFVQTGWRAVVPSGGVAEDNVQPELITHVTAATDSVRLLCVDSSDPVVTASASEASITAVPVPTLNGA